VLSSLCDASATSAGGPEADVVFSSVAESDRLAQADAFHG
jgi:hypothetical protein